MINVQRCFRILVAMLAALLSFDVAAVQPQRDRSSAIAFKSSEKDNIFTAERSSVEITPAIAGAKVLALTVKDEYGKTVNLALPALPAPNVILNLPQRGYYAIDAQVTGQAGSWSTTAAVIGQAASADPHSPFGIWTVHGDPKQALKAGSTWARQIWNLRDYRLDKDGRIISQRRKRGDYQGMKLIGTLAYGLPDWLTSDPSTTRTKKLAAPKDWDKFKELVAMFANDIEPFAPYFEIYNEPEYAWQGNEADLVKMLITIADIIRTARPSTKIIGPTFANLDVDRLRRYQRLGFFDHIDGLSIHPYVEGTAPEGKFIQKIREIKAFLVETGHAEMPIYMSEWGWTTAAGGWQPPVSELVQAQYLTRSLALMRAEKIDALLYFCLRFNSQQAGVREFSVVHADGTPKPAYAAFANVVRWLSPAIDSRRLDTGSTTEMVVYRTPDHSVLTAWAPAGAPTPKLPESLGNWEDMMGRPLSGALPQLSGSPIFARIADPGFFDVHVESALSARAGDTLKIDGLTAAPTPLKITADGQLKIPANTISGIYFIACQFQSNWILKPLSVKNKP
ncbi:hypothetical protein [Solimonas soli]|uniref:hypothetical protein n=1 Tax=Solimonas soli TaxID=413479 RepID=UPI0012F9F0C0|nr:hypothetical protein [Solimonas soli]